MELVSVWFELKCALQSIGIAYATSVHSDSDGEVQQRVFDGQGTRMHGDSVEWAAA